MSVENFGSIHTVRWAYCLHDKVLTQTKCYLSAWTTAIAIICSYDSTHRAFLGILLLTHWLTQSLPVLLVDGAPVDSATWHISTCCQLNSLSKSTFACIDGEQQCKLPNFNSCLLQNLQISLNAGFWNSAELRSIEQSALTCLSRSSNCTCTLAEKSPWLFTCMKLWTNQKPLLVAPFKCLPAVPTAVFLNRTLPVKCTWLRHTLVLSTWASNFAHPV